MEKILSNLIPEYALHVLFNKKKKKKKKRKIVLQCKATISPSGCLIVARVDSLVSNVTGGWMDKTKDQINSFSYLLIAQWELKFFVLFFLLKVLAKLLIYLVPLEYGVPSHLPSSKKTVFEHLFFHSTLATLFRRAVYQQDKM